MTPNEKNKVYIIGGIAAAFIGYKMFFAQDGGGLLEDPTGNGNNPIPGNNPSAFNASFVATALYDAMKDTGTNENRILSVLRSVNQSQFGEVFKAFGKKSYNSQLGNQINFSPFFALPLANLQEWLQSELSEDEYNIMYLKYPNYL